MSAEAMNPAVADSDEPDPCIGTAGQQPIRGGQGVLAHFELAPVDVDGNDLAAILRLNEWTDLLS